LPQASQREVAVEGVRFALYRTDPPGGQGGTPALLLHGVPQTAQMWHPLFPELARDRVVLAPDLKGLGRSEVRAPYDIPTLVGELAALVLHEVDTRVDVVGHDWGGSLAIALAAARPELVRRLVVCNAPYRYVDFRRAWHMLLFAVPGVPEVLLQLAGPHRVDRMIRRAWRAPRPMEPACAEHYRQAYEDRSRRSAMLGYYRAVVRSRLRHGLTGGTTPGGTVTGRRGGRRQLAPERSLVVWGMRDPLLPLSVARSVVRDLGGEVTLVEVAGAGHFVVEEAPEVVVPAIAEFLREPGAGAPA
jgi:pimeloyl-ACP methyl ester carboxylesterase